MTIISSEQDREALTLTFVVELAAPPARVWQLWADPRQLERWWGPPTWPATFEQHDLEVGGGSQYFMTGPEGEKARGWWTFLALDEPRSLEFEDGFSDESGVPNDDMPTTFARVELEPGEAAEVELTIDGKKVSVEGMHHTSSAPAREVQC